MLASSNFINWFDGKRFTKPPSPRLGHSYWKVGCFFFFLHNYLDMQCSNYLSIICALRKLFLEIQEKQNVLTLFFLLYS